MDVVYFTRANEGIELRYSLRSLMNVEHDRVFFIGPMPDWAQGVEHIDLHYKDKWVALQEKFAYMCDDDNLSKTVLLFEDDMYVTKPRAEWPLVFHSTLDGMLQIRPRDSGPWGKSVGVTKDYLEDIGVAVPMSYEAHVPVPVDRKQGQKIMRALPEGLGHIRPHSLYGNLANKSQKRVLGNNAKVVSNEDLVRLLRLHTPFLSSLDGSFELARVRQALNLIGLKEPCKYER